MNHVNKIRNQLLDVDAILLLSEANCFYATNFQGEGACLVSKAGTFYFTDSRYYEAAKKKITGYRVTEFGGTHPFMDCLDLLLQKLQVQVLAVENDYVTLTQMKRMQEKLHVEFVEGSDIMHELRASKDPEEIAIMEKAQRISEVAYKRVLGEIHEGVTEREIAAKLQYEMLMAGAEGMSFDPIVASGPNTSMPHAVPTDRQMQRGEFITMDFGCIYQGYCSDMTRTVALGKVSSEMEEVYDVVLNAQLMGIACARPGIPGSDIDKAARHVILEAGYGEYFGHGFGHSLGIEVHESPNASPSDHTLIPKGAVMSAEPGIYIPGKFGVRIEDVIALKARGCEILTNVPKDLIIL